MRNALAAAFVIAAAAGLLFWLGKSNPERDRIATAPNLAPIAIDPPADTSASAKRQASRGIELSQPSHDVEHSLSGTEADGTLNLDATGALIFDPELKRIFDYYLSRTGELSERDLLEWANTELARRFPLHAQALQHWFLRYLHMQQNLAARAPQLAALSLDERLQALQAIRIEALGESVANGLFANEYAWSKFSIAKRALAQQAKAENRDAQWIMQQERMLAKQLPAELNAMWQTEREQQALQSNDIATVSALAGTEAAMRLSTEQNSHAEFQRRVRNYLQIRNASKADTEGARSALRQRLLHADDIARVAALERIGQEASLLD